MKKDTAKHSNGSVVLIITERRPLPDDPEVGPTVHAPPATYTVLPVWRECLVLRHVLCRVADDASMRPGSCNFHARVSLERRVRAQNVRPRLPEPVRRHESHADHEQVVVRGPALLGLQLPDAAPLWKLPPAALYEGIELSLPDLPVARVGRWVCQCEEEQAAVNLDDGDGAEQLLEASPRSAAKFPHLAPGMCGWLATRARVRPAQLRAGATYRSGNRRGPNFGEVWTVDKVSARLGARRFAEEDERASSRSIRNCFTMSAMLGQGRFLCLALSRAPPLVRGRFLSELGLRYAARTMRRHLSAIPERTE